MQYTVKCTRKNSISTSKYKIHYYPGSVMSIHVACLWMWVLFYFSLVCLHECAYAFKFQVHCGSAFEPGASGLPYYCTSHVTVPDVWRQNTHQKKSAWQKKLRGNRKKIVRKSRNSRKLSSGGVGAKDMVTKSENWRQSWNQIQTVKECLCCQNFYAHLGTPWHTLARNCYSLPRSLWSGYFKRTGFWVESSLQGIS